MCIEEASFTTREGHGLCVPVCEDILQSHLQNRKGRTSPVKLLGFHEPQLLSSSIFGVAFIVLTLFLSSHFPP